MGWPICMTKMFTKPFQLDSLWKSEMQKAGHIPLLLKNPRVNTPEVKIACTKNHFEPTDPFDRYKINRLAMSYNEYSKKYWEQVKYRQELYRLERNR